MGELVEPSSDGLTVAEVRLVAGAVAAATSPVDGLTPVQQSVLNAMCDLGVAVDTGTVDHIAPDEFARAMASHDRSLITRIVQAMLVGELLLSPLAVEVCERVERYARELGVDDEALATARDIAHGSLGMAMADFERSGYFDHLGDHPAVRGLHESAEAAWQREWDDPELAERWESLGTCPPGSLGLAVWRFYKARGFAFPGNPHSAPPFLAQHDFVHVLAEYGSTVESEVEVFGLVARASPDFRAFSLLAMVLSLFETGAIAEGAGGFFERDAGHISTDAERMGIRLGDAMSRGKRMATALSSRGRSRDADLLALEWFAYAEWAVDDVRTALCLPPKAERAITAGSVTPFEAGGISPYQLRAGRQQAERTGHAYESWGAASIRPAADDH